MAKTRQRKSELTEWQHHRGLIRRDERLLQAGRRMRKLRQWLARKAAALEAAGREYDAAILREMWQQYLSRVLGDVRSARREVERLLTSGGRLMPD